MKQYIPKQTRLSFGTISLFRPFFYFFPLTIPTIVENSVLATSGEEKESCLSPSFRDEPRVSILTATTLGQQIHFPPNVQYFSKIHKIRNNLVFRQISVKPAHTDGQEKGLLCESKTLHGGLEGAKLRYTCVRMWGNTRYIRFYTLCQSRLQKTCFVNFQMVFKAKCL